MCLPFLCKRKALRTLNDADSDAQTSPAVPQLIGREILRYRVSMLAGARINIATTATPERYRLINGVEYVRHNILSVQELTDLSSTPYAAISYIWKGNALPTEEREGWVQATFSVEGGEDADPVSISVLRDACKVALLEGVEWLWLDCLCIIQTDRTDKAWQIKRMYDIYRGCRVSIVLPGGLSRLVPVDEETKWITRAWTLQEVVAPSRAVVLFAWEHGSGRWAGWEGGVEGEVREVSQRASAKMPLHQLLNACHHPQALTWAPDDGMGSRDDIGPSILGGYGDSGVGALLFALNATKSEERAMALWQSSMLRTSSRPVDMVFSIMGAFGVTLEPRLFDSQDRIGATIALAQGILRQGGKPVWLGLSLDIHPSPFISSFPDFPVTNVAGNVRWDTRRGHFQQNVSDAIYDIDSMNEEIDDGDQSEGKDASSVFLPQHWLTDLPSGTMDNHGYLTISCRAARIVPTGQVFGRRRTHLVQNNDHIAVKEFADAPHGMIRVASTDGRIWDVFNDFDFRQPANSNGSLHVVAYIVIIGTSKKFYLDSIYQPDPRPIGGILLPEMSTIRACAVEEHGPGKFHRSSTFLLDVNRFGPIIDRWPRLSIAIGGPNEIPPNTHIACRL